MIRILMGLFRPRLAALNGVAAVGGYLLFPGMVEQVVCWRVFAGVALLAAGGSALNQVMERDIDRLMERTRHRPIPGGEVTPLAATVIGCAVIVAGFMILAFSGYLPPMLGLAALSWYLGIYTPLKRRTSLAPVLGAVCGAIPPVIGWCSTGGAPDDYRVMLLAGVLFLWQIPHFWLFQRRHSVDYCRAGLPLLAPPGGEFGFSRFCTLWLGAIFVALSMLPAFGVIGPWSGSSLLVIPIILLILTRRSEGLLFSGLNLLPLLVTLAVAMER